MELCASTFQDLILGLYTGPKVGSHKEVLLQISRGVEYLHSNGVVHRDIKPANIYISLPNGAKPPLMKIGDIGLRRVVLPGHQFTLDQLAGTEVFMAPEVCQAGSFTSPMDIYSLGCSFMYNAKNVNVMK